MWEVENHTPFAAAGDWVRDRDGAEVWLVAVRCSFRVRPDGTTAVAEEQPPPVFGPVYCGDPARSSLLHDSDFLLTKPTTDILLNGHAYAPGGRPSTSVDVTMRVGDVRKALRVVGDRIYQRSISGITAGAPQPFLRIPLTYERAPGGYAPSPSADPQRPQFSATNPVGRGFVPAAGEAAPNIESLGSSSSATPVAGFGAIAFHWQSRAGHAGTYDAAWQRDRMPLYPDDLDDRFFLASPEDQRPKEFLNGGEPVELFNLSPTGQQTFVLPKIALRFETEFRDGPAVNHRGNLYSVILEPDESRVVMVWRTSLRVHARALKLERTTITQLRVINAPSGSVPLDAEAGDIDSGELAA